MHQLKSICCTKADSHPIHTCFPIIASNPKGDQRSWTESGSQTFSNAVITITVAELCLQTAVPRGFTWKSSRTFMAQLWNLLSLFCYFNRNRAFNWVFLWNQQNVNFCYVLEILHPKESFFLNCPEKKHCRDKVCELLSSEVKQTDYPSLHSNLNETFLIF